MSRKFALHPGWVTSKNDGQLHYVGAGQLIKLYKLDHDEFLIWPDSIDSHSLLWDRYVHLYPNYYGNYGRPE